MTDIQLNELRNLRYWRDIFTMQAVPRIDDQPDSVPVSGCVNHTF